MWNFVSKLLREPVVQFALFGVFLFGYFYAVNDPAPGAAEPSAITVTDNDVARLIEQHESVWRRAPTQGELETAIDGYVRSEILVREALALGLDRGDAAIRNRLQQKMLFLTNSMAQTLEPDDDILRSYMSDNQDQFMSPAKLAFEQVFLGPAADAQVIANIRTSLAQGVDPMSLGQRSTLPATMKLTPQIRIDAAFGTGFADLVKSSAPGQWVGPIKSGFGYHLVRLGDVQPAAPLDLQANRARILGFWRQEQSKLLGDAQYALMRERYDVALPDAAQLERYLSR